MASSVGLRVRVFVVAVCVLIPAAAVAQGFGVFKKTVVLYR